MNAYELFTDGGCWPNPGDGAWAYILRQLPSGKEVKQVGKEKQTTNNRCELLAVIRGLTKVPTNSKVTLYSDSQYVVKGLMAWRHGWRQRKWIGVLNDDLWQKLDRMVDKLNFHAVWVRGHDNHPENEECDKMCFAAYRN